MTYNEQAFVSFGIAYCLLSIACAGQVTLGHAKYRARNMCMNQRKPNRRLTHSEARKILRLNEGKWKLLDLQRGTPTIVGPSAREQKLFGLQRII